MKVICTEPTWYDPDCGLVICSPSAAPFVLLSPKIGLVFVVKPKVDP